MKQDIILAGVGGQGILSIAYVIDNAAMEQDLIFKQAEVHGMAQRGGAVQSHLRLADENIFSDLIPRGKADMILSVEPMEAIRYLEYLASDGVVITSSTPFVNIPDYPDMEDILAAVRKVGNSIIVDSTALAKEAGSSRAQNIVMLGAAAGNLILQEQYLLKYVEELFAPRGKNLVDINLKAFRLGKEVADNPV